MLITSHFKMMRNTIQFPLCMAGYQRLYSTSRINILQVLFVSCAIHIINRVWPRITKPSHHKPSDTNATGGPPTIYRPPVPPFLERKMKINSPLFCF